MTEGMRANKNIKVENQSMKFQNEEHFNEINNLNDEECHQDSPKRFMISLEKLDSQQSTVTIGRILMKTEPHAVTLRQSSSSLHSEVCNIPGFLFGDATAKLLGKATKRTVAVANF
jgi:hypothetical protein